MSIKLDQCDPKLRERIVRQMEQDDRQVSQTLSGAGGMKGKGVRHTQSVPTDYRRSEAACRRVPRPRMNKTELRFFEVLKQRFPESHITPQFRLRISQWDAPVQCFYTADFLVSASIGAYWNHTLYECKNAKRKYHSNELKGPKLVRLSCPWISSVILATWTGSSFTEKTIA